MEKNCPQCENHCPVEDLKCGEGRSCFGIEKGDRREARPERPEERMITLLRKCGHYLHHSVGPDADLSAMVNVLSPDERATPERLLEKCLGKWQSR